VDRLGRAHSLYVCLYFSIFVYFCTIFIFIIITVLVIHYVRILPLSWFIFRLYNGSMADIFRHLYYELDLSINQTKMFNVHSKTGKKPV